MQSSRTNVALKQTSTERVKKHREKNKNRGYKRQIFLLGPTADFKIRRYAKLRKKPLTHILDDLMKNVF